MGSRELNDKAYVYAIGCLNMNKWVKLFSAVTITTGIMGCNSTSSSTINNIAFGPQKVASNSQCRRSNISETVNVTPENLSLTTNAGTGCFGVDNPFCDLRIYQVMVESFKHGNNGALGYDIAWGPSSHKGNIRGIIESLSYIKSTGANALWLTPVFLTQRIEGQDETYDKLDGTGYFTSNYFAIDPKFGTMDDMRELVTKAHKIGLYVIMDGVFGHAKDNVVTTSPNGNKLVLSKRCRDWDGYVDKMSLFHGTCFKTQESMEFLKEFAAYWINELKIDGWRLDQAYQLAPEEWKVIREVVSQTSKKKNNSYELNGKLVQPLGFMVGEYWNERPMVIDRNGFKDNALPAVMNFPLRGALVRVLATSGEINKKDCGLPASNLNDINKQANGYSGDAITTMLLGNHDFPRFGDLLQRAGNAEDGIKSEEYMKAHEMALSFVTQTSGPIVLYYGEETGDELPGFSAKVEKECYVTMVCEDHVSRTNGHVEHLTADESALKNKVSRMFKLRNKHKSLAHGTRTHIYSDDTLYIDLKAYKDDKVIYALNNSNAPRTVNLSKDALARLGLSNCTFTDLMTKQPVNGTTFKLSKISGSFFEAKCK